jgi:HSP20 family protein
MRLAHDPVMRMLLNNFINQEQQTERKCRWTPATNITEDKESFHLEMAIPGFSKEDFKISLEKNILSVSSEFETDETTEEKKDYEYRMHEFGKRNFCRSFTLSEETNKDGIKAEYVNGILKINLPKKEEVKVTKEIQVL